MEDTLLPEGARYFLISPEGSVQEYGVNSEEAAAALGSPRLIVIQEGDYRESGYWGTPNMSLPDQERLMATLKERTLVPTHPLVKTHTLQQDAFNKQTALDRGFKVGDLPGNNYTLWRKAVSITVCDPQLENKVKSIEELESIARRFGELTGSISHVHWLLSRDQLDYVDGRAGRLINLGSVVIRRSFDSFTFTYDPERAAKLQQTFKKRYERSLKKEEEKLKKEKESQEVQAVNLTAFTNWIYAALRGEAIRRGWGWHPGWHGSPLLGPNAGGRSWAQLRRSGISWKIPTNGAAHDYAWAVVINGITTCCKLIGDSDNNQPKSLVRTMANMIIDQRCNAYRKYHRDKNKLQEKDRPSQKIIEEGAINAASYAIPEALRNRIKIEGMNVSITIVRREVTKIILVDAIHSLKLLKKKLEKHLKTPPSKRNGAWNAKHPWTGASKDFFEILLDSIYSWNSGYRGNTETDRLHAEFRELFEGMPEALDFGFANRRG